MGIAKNQIFFSLASQKIQIFTHGHCKKIKTFHLGIAKNKKKSHRHCKKRCLLESMVLYLKEHGESI